MKGRDITTMQAPAQASWVIWKVFDARKHLSNLPGGMAMLLQQHMSISKVYNRLRGSFEHVSWRKILCNNPSPPKCIFIIWLAVLGRLSTCDNMLKIGVHCDQVCCLCNRKNESVEHLFFACSFSYEVFSKALLWLGIQRSPKPWSEEIHILETHYNKNAVRHQIYRLIVSVAVYLVWRERNHRKFQNTSRTPAAIIHELKLISYTRCIHSKKLLGFLP